MATFSKCLAIINKMSQQDQDALLARLDELQAQGLTAKEAQMQAAVDTLAQVQQEASIKKSPERPDLVAAADAIAAMDPEVRDNTEIGDFPGAASGYNLYEARQLVKKPSDKLKRVTESNTFSLWQNYDYVANVDGDHFGVTKEEDPDEVDDETKFVYSFENLKSPFDSGKTTSTDQTDELFKEMRESLGKDIRKSVERPEFYSQLQRAIDQVPQRLSTMAAPAWKQWLTANAPKLGIKAEEIEWSGIKDWLDLEGHPKPVYESGFGLVEEMKNGSGEWEQTDDLGHYFRTKAEAEAAITDEMKASAEQFGKKYETEGRISVKHFDGDALNFGKTTTPKITKEDISRYLDDSGVKVREVTLGGVGADGELYSRETDGGDWEIVDDRAEPFGGTFATEEEAEAAIAEMNSAGPTKYGKYTLPGGENYREVLLTLPGTFEFLNDADRRRDSASSLSDKLERDGVSDDDPRWIAAQEEYVKADAAREAAYARAQGMDEIKYQSSHWDQANILAHIRVNDRTDSDGKRVLFVEEVQSDWGQEGKKKGFNDRERSVQTELRRAGWTIDQGEDGIWVVLDRDGDAMGDGPTREIALERSGAGARNVPAIPAAPFVTKTEGWLNLALKRIAMLAVEGGYDKVAFINGDQSADRYDLSKKVNYIQWNPGHTATRKLISLETTDGKDLGITVQDGVVEDSSIGANGKPLDEVLGKEVAKKILGADSGTLRGLDLKMGGEGMKTFYDQIVPQAISKLLPKLGGEKLGVTQVNVGDKEAIAKWKRMTANSTIESTPIKEYETQPGFDVTDKMRETVGQGTPLFSREREDTPEFKEWSHGLPVHESFVDAASDRGVFKLYHATPKDFTEFKPGGENPKDSGPAIWLASSPNGTAASWRVGNEQSGWKDGANIMPVYARLERPLLIDSKDMMSWARKVYATSEFPQLMSQQTVDDLKADGYDSIIVKEEPLKYGKGNDEIIVFDPEQIKSAIGNNGEYSSTSPDIRKSPDRPWFDDLSQLKVSKTYQLGDLLKTSKKLSWWNRTIGTQYDLAQKHPQFKRVFDAVQHFIDRKSVV